MDLSNFKKVRDAGATAHFQHPDGHEITISKKNLSPEMRKHMDALPLHMSDAGEVPDIEKPDYANTPVDQLALPAEPTREQLALQRVNSIGDSLKNAYTGAKQVLFDSPDKWGQQPAPSGPPPSLMQQQNIQPVASDTPQEVPQQGPSVGQQQPPQAPGSYDPYGFQASGNMQTQAFDSQLQGITGAATAEANAGYAQAKAAQDHIKSMQQTQMDYQKHMADIEGEVKGTIADMNAGHVDPQHFFNSRSDWQKAALVIGMAMGGNPEIIRHAIDRDIEGQKANLQNKNNVLAAQFHRMGNLRDATDMSRMIQAGIYADKLQMIASQAQSPIAKARAMTAAGKLYEAYAPVAQQVAMRRTMTNDQAQGHQPDPAMMVQALIQDPAQRAKAMEHVGKIESIEALRRNVEASAQALAKKPLGGMLTPSDRASHLNTFAGILATTAEHRFNLEESKIQMDALMGKGFDSRNTLKDKALHRQQFFDSLRAEHEAPLRAMGIQMPRARVSFSEGAPVK